MSSPVDEAKELQQMLVSYAKQETIEPLKSLGRYLGLGVAGSIMIFVGTFFFGLGSLRLVQTVGTFSGSGAWSMVPYVVAILVLVIISGLILVALSRAKKKVH